MKADVVLLSGESAEIEIPAPKTLSSDDDPLEFLLAAVNSHEFFKSRSVEVWRLVSDGDPLVSSNVVEQILAQESEGDVTLLALTRPREEEDVVTFPSTSYLPTSTTPEKQRSSEGVGASPTRAQSSPSAYLPDERSICVQERLVHQQDFLPAENKEAISKIPEDDRLPYVAACRLSIEISNGTFYNTLCQLMGELEEEIKREEEAKTAEASRKEAGSSPAVDSHSEVPRPDPAELEAQLAAMVPSAETLQAMGFSDQAILRCMLDCQLNEEDALNKILSVDNAEALAAPLTEAEITRYATMYGMIEPPSQRVSGDGEADSARETEPFDPKLAQLIDMGFSRAEAKKALRAAAGDLEEASAALLGDPVAIDRGLQRTAQTGWYTALEEEVRERNIEVDTMLFVAKEIGSDPNSISSVWADPKARKVLKLMLRNFSESSQRVG